MYSLTLRGCVRTDLHLDCVADVREIRTSLGKALDPIMHKCSTVNCIRQNMAVHTIDQ